MFPFISSLFFSRDYKKAAACKELLTARASRERAEIAIPAIRLASRIFTAMELLRCLDILRGLTARRSFMRRLYIPHQIIPDAPAMHVRELHALSTSYRYVRLKNYALRSA